MSSSLQTLQRGLRLLDILDAAPSGYTFTEAANELQVSAGTMSRLLTTLMDLGYVEYDEKTRHYGLGLSAVQLGGGSQAATGIASVARPHLVSLMRTTGMRTNLATLRGTFVYYLDAVDSPDSAEVFRPHIRRHPAHSTALGKVLLAYEMQLSLDDLRAMKLVQYTSRTVTDPQKLLAALALVREKGYATEMGENVEAQGCVAAPVRDYAARVVAAISISTSLRNVQDNEADLASKVIEAGAEVSTRLGFSGETAS